MEIRKFSSLAKGSACHENSMSIIFHPQEVIHTQEPRVGSAFPDLEPGDASVPGRLEASPKEAPNFSSIV